MQKIRKLMAWVLCLCLILGFIPAAAAANDGTCTVALTGNTGATVTCNTTPLSADVDNNDLAIVEIRGNQVRVIGKDGAVGIARLTVQTAAGYQVFDIPIGYTTFVFNGNQLTVISGSSTNFEVAGVNAADEEYLVGSADFPLPVATDANGNSVYSNTDAYKLCVGLKKAGGTYVFTGTGTDSCIAVKKQATAPTTILLAGLDLTSSFTAPITVKKESTTTATITALAGFTNTLTDNAFNNADTYGDPTEDGGNGQNAAYAESAVIKGKSYSNVTLNGEGTLNLVCNTKNALKVGEYGSLTIDELTLNITSVKNGISSDNTMVINGGNVSVTTSGGDAIRSDPDAVNAAAGCAGNITVNGGTFNIQASSDGFQAAQDLTINGGDFTIKTGKGYNDNTFNKNTMSCKGLKASDSSDDSTNTEAGTNLITINGGTFNLNTADDAIHSNGLLKITGGEFTIQTGDDGAHADDQADFGVENGNNCAIHMTVSTCYEGLEAINLYVHSGCYDITASDDGINAAGGSSNGSDPDPWNPWNPGPGPGNPGDYTLKVSGGMLNVNANGDGLDSNGDESLTGGSIIVWGMQANGDNSPLDCDGTLLIKGATVFGAGSRQMAESPSSSSQPYVTYGSSGWGGGGSSSSISSGRTVNVKNSSSQTVFSIKAPKNINYAIYSSPSMTSSSGWSITGDTSTPTVTRYWTEHSYGSYVQTTAPTCTEPGVSTATCSICGGTVTQSIAALGHSWSRTTVAPTATQEGYDLYTCSRCGGQYRTNFTDPTGGSDPCADGHTWNAGVVTVQPTCTQPGTTVFTCTVCGETMTADSPSALGHSFNNNGICSRCGMEAFKANFVCSTGASVTVYPTQDLTSGGTENASFAFPRSSTGGAIDVSGEGQINFVVVLQPGYAVESVTAEPIANFKNLKIAADPTVPNSYRITKVTGPITVTVNASTNVCDHEFDDNGVCVHCGYEAPKVTFACDAHSSVTAYPTQDLTSGGVNNAAFALARDSATGQIDITGNGQVNYVLHIDDGYVLDTMTAQPTTNYKNLKDNGDGSYRLTKLIGHVTLSVTTRTDGLADGFYLIGPDGWTKDDIDPDNVFAANPAVAGEYLLETTLNAGDSVKVVKVEGGAITAWYPGTQNSAYVVDEPHAGDVTVYFRETYQSNWASFGGYIYIPAATRYTVHFSVPAGVDPVADLSCAAGGSVTLPTANAPAGYSFLGWVVDTYDHVAQRPADILTGNYTVTGDVTLNALYTYTEGGSDEISYDLVTEAPQDWSGKYVITYLKTTGLYAMTGIASGYYDNGGSSVTAFSRTGMTLSGNKLTNVADSYCFQVEAKGSAYTLQSVSQGSYVQNNGTLRAATGYTAGSCDWTFALGGAGNALITCPSRSTSIGFSTAYKCFWAIDSSEASNIFLWKQTGAGTAYYTTVINAAVLDESLTLYSSISVGVEIQTTFGVRRTQVQNYQSWYFEVCKLDASGNVTECKRFGPGQEGAVTDGYIINAVYTDITAKEMGVTYKATLHCFDVDGSEIYSKTATNTLRDYLIGEFTNADNTAQMRTLCADMLNYGATAQVFFDYDVAHLVNQNLSATAAAAKAQYETKTEAPANLVNSENGPNLYGSVSIMNRVVLGLTARNLNTTGTVQIRVKDHATGATKATLETTKRGSVYTADYDKIEAEDMRTEFDFVTLVNGIETGNTLTWSVEGYVRASRENPETSVEELALLNAMLIYVDSAANVVFTAN